MNGGPSIIRRSTSEKSNRELTNSLRANFLTSKQAFTPEPNGSSEVNGIAKGPQPTVLNHHYPPWTNKQDDTIFVPAIDFSSSGLSEERSQYDITAKLFFLPSTKTSKTCLHTREAISLVLKELHVPSIDLLIVSFQGVSFDADDDEDEYLEDNQDLEAENLKQMVKTWQILEQLHNDGVVAQIGLAEFGS